MGLHEDLMRDPVSAMPLRRALTVRPSTPVRLVVAQMKERGLGAAVLVDDQSRPVGLFTERILARMLATGTHTLAEPIEDHVIPADAVTVSIDDPIVRALKVMQSTELRFICVVDAQGKVIKLGGIRGLVEYVVEHFPRAVKVQELGSKLYMDDREGA